MKTTIIKYFSWCLFICIFSSGCVDLDVSPTNKFTDENYWTSEEKAASLLHMAYRQMNSTEWVFRDERLSDNLYNGYGGDDIKTISNGQATSSTGLFDKVWGEIYGGIKTTHTLLANIDRVEMDENLKNRMKAEARFIRAFLYFQLTNWYGDVPFFTQDIDEQTARTIGRTKQATIVEWIHQELEEIAEILPAKERYARADRGRITCGAAVAFNARVALNFNDWERVKKYTEKLIDKADYGRYSLHSNYQEIFYKANEYNNEIILDIQYVPKVRTWSDISVYVPFNLESVQYIVASPAQSLIDTYLMRDGSKWDEAKSAYENRDPRMDMTIVRHGSIVPKRDGSSYTVNVNPNGASKENKDKIGHASGSQTGYFYRKYYDPNPSAWTVGTSWSCNINFVTLRYADVLLMYAEAMYELEKMTPEIWEQTITQLRRRAGFNETPAAMDYPTSGDIRQIIRDERRVELALEGTRIYDIRRWKIAEEVLNEPFRGAKFKLSGGDLTYFSYHENSFNRDRDYLWAVPRQQFTINPNLGQNPGY